MEIFMMLGRFGILIYFLFVNVYWNFKFYVWKYKLVVGIFMEMFLLIDRSGLVIVKLNVVVVIEK